MDKNLFPFKSFFRPSLIFFYVFIIMWTLFWGMNLGHTVIKRIPYYSIALKSSNEELRVIRSYNHDIDDYFSILEFCDKSLPSKESLRLIIPASLQNNYEYMRDKGRYFLYPRNFGNNDLDSRNILVYQVKNFPVPKGFKIKTQFSEDKYLLVESETK